METKVIARPALLTALILMVPLLAMQFTAEVNWTMSDFVIMGVILFGFGFAYEFVTGKGDSLVFRAATGLAVLTSFLLVWSNLAVGIIGDDNPANLFYFGVILVGIIGALVARFRAEGMSYVMFAMAGAQLLVPVIALLIWSPQTTSWSPGVAIVFVLNAVFALMFAFAGLLYKTSVKR